MPHAARGAGALPLWRAALWPVVWLSSPRAVAGAPSWSHDLSTLPPTQADLGNVSSEIQTLQDQSLSMSQKLKNRKQIQGPLGDFVGKMVISPQLVDNICAANVDPDFEVGTATTACPVWLRSLITECSRIPPPVRRGRLWAAGDGQVAIAELDVKLAFAASLPANTVSVEDTQLDLERLQAKAAAKIRECVAPCAKILGVRAGLLRACLSHGPCLHALDGNEPRVARQARP